jgi:pyrroloquinoline quinone (PQQ) biosynthesis protein C
VSAGESGEVEWVVAAQAARLAAGSDWLWSELGLIAERWNPTRHLFLARWSAGELDAPELCSYAEEHEQLVLAAANVAAGAAGKASGLLADVLGEHADRLALDLDRWRAFARAAGWDPRSAWYYAADPLPATRACARIWAPERRGLAADLVTLHAIELLWAGCSRRLLEGLLGRYRLDEGVAVEFFRQRVIAEADADRAEMLRAGLEGLLGGTDLFALLAQAEATHRAYWGVLDALVEVQE